MASPTIGACGRPSKLDISQYIPYFPYQSSPISTIVAGDINYGIAAPPKFYPANPIPLGSVLDQVPPGYYEPSSDPSCGATSLSCPIYNPGSGGCVYPYTAMGCPVTSSTILEEQVFTPASWSGQEGSIGQALVCCANQASDSGTCSPDMCAENPSFCQPAMMKACTPTQWVNSGPNSTVGALCDQYITNSYGVQGPSGLCQTGPDCAASLIYTALESFQSQGGKFTDDDPFIPKIIQGCSKYPGLCDPLLVQGCSKFAMESLSPVNYAGRTNDPQGTNLMQLCGCMLSQGEYVSGVDIACQSSCAFPGTIPLSSGGMPLSKPTSTPLSAASCSSTKCAIDGVSVSYINSTHGSIGINQVCGNLGNLGQCYFNGLSASSISPGTTAGFQISSTCGTCFDYDPSTGLSTPTPGGCPKTSTGEWFSEAAEEAESLASANTGLILQFMAVLAVALIMYMLYRILRSR